LVELDWRILEDSTYIVVATTTLLQRPFCTSHYLLQVIVVMTIAASLPKSASSNEMAHIINNNKKLNVQEAVALARQIRFDLEPKTKDRKWRLKSYADCFTGKHVLQWAMEHVSSDEYVSVSTLNQLIAYGLLVHVVDPTKKIRVGETRTLYFRIASTEVLDRESNLSTLIAASGSNNGHLIEDLATIHKQVMDIDHTLQRTVKQLNYTRGKMDVIHQEVLGLISQQISTFVVIFINLICVLVHSHNNNKSGYISATALAITMIVSTHYCWRCINLWSTLDLDDRGMMPIETIVVDYEDGSESYDLDTPLVENSNNTRRRSIAAVIQNSFKFARLNSLRRGSSSMNNDTTTIVRARDEYSLPNVNEWVHRPLLICANTVAIPTMITDTPNNNGYLPLGIPFNFSSDLFEGLCLIRVKGANSDAIEEDAKYFSGRKRIFQSIVQGRFKEEVNVSDCMTGHEFTRPLKNLPHPIILKTATNLLGRFQPGATICVHTDQPYISATLLETTQIFRGDQPGNEPNIANHNIQEDSSILGGIFATDTIPASRRKRIFSNPSTCPNVTFDTETVYTFEFYQNSFDAQSYSLDLGFTKLALSKVFDHQPIQWLGKMKDGRYLWSFQIWNESLLSKK
jgi:hypothetical protein